MVTTAEAPSRAACRDGWLSPASLLIASLVCRTASSLASTTMPRREDQFHVAAAHPQFDDPVVVGVGRAQRG